MVQNPFGELKWPWTSSTVDISIHHSVNLSKHISLNDSRSSNSDFLITTCESQVATLSLFPNRLTKQKRELWRSIAFRVSEWIVIFNLVSLIFLIEPRRKTKIYRYDDHWKYLLSCNKLYSEFYFESYGLGFSRMHVLALRIWSHRLEVTIVLELIPQRKFL